MGKFRNCEVRWTVKHERYTSLVEFRNNDEGVVVRTVYPVVERGFRSDDCREKRPLHLPSLHTDPTRDWSADDPLTGGDLQAKEYSVDGGLSRGRLLAGFVAPSSSTDVWRRKMVAMKIQSVTIATFLAIHAL